MKKILVVDDSVVNLKMAEKVLKENEDYKSILVPSGDRALKFLSKNKPDLILLDIMMPDMDGFEVMSQFRKQPDLQDVPVIFLTADDTEDTQLKAEKAGAKGLLLKPFKKDVLLDLVAKYLSEEEA